VNLTLNDAVIAVTADLRAAGGHSYLTHTSGTGHVQITVTRPMDGRDEDDAWALLVAAGASGQDIATEGDHLKAPVYVASGMDKVWTVHLVVQYGVHADVLFEDAADPVSLIPRQQGRPGQREVIREDGAVEVAR
jgi:hypothetical protein